MDDNPQRPLKTRSPDTGWLDIGFRSHTIAYSVGEASRLNVRTVESKGKCEEQTVLAIGHFLSHMQNQLAVFIA